MVRVPFLRRLVEHFILICALNAPFWILGRFVFINRPLFNYDTIIASIVASFCRPLGLLALVWSWLIDGVVSQSSTYQFLSPIDFLESARFGGQVNWLQYFMGWHASIFIIIFIPLFLFFKFFNRSSAVSNSLVFFIIGISLLSLDSINGASDLWRRDRMIVPINISGSPGYTLVKSVLRPPVASGVRKISTDQSIIKKFNVIQWASDNTDRSILFVVVESLGVPKSTVVRDWLNASTSTPLYSTNFYEIEFKGATTSGELRSLCGLEGSYTSVTETSFSDCMPSQLSRLWWKTSGFHGFSMQMFNRKIWWPYMGLNNNYFVESSGVEDLSRCGNVFRGVCDKDIIDFAAEYLKEPRSFAYVLTLNTHLPVVPTQLPPVLSSACSQEGIPDDACMHIAALHNVLANVVSAALALPKPPLVVAVGDHAPPFSGLDSRNSFKQNLVPAYVLVPSK